MSRRTTLTLAAVATLMAGGAQAAGELFLYNWSNYYPPELLKEFEKETGIKVTLDVYDSNETMLAKLQAGASGYDIVVPSDYMVETMIKEGLAVKIDAGQMPNFKNVAAPHNAPPFDPKREYSAPYMWGVTGFSYDKSRVPNGKLDESWAVFFQPPAPLKGQVVALNDEVELYKAAAIYLGLDQCTENNADAQKIFELLSKQKPDLAMYQSDGTIERMIAKEVIVHMQWNGAAHRSKQGNKDVVFVYPKEGLSFWNDNFMVAKGAKNIDNAKTFINWMMEPKNIAAASNYTGYMNGVPSSVEFLKAEMKADPAVVAPAGTEKLFVPTKTCSEAARDLRNKVWTRLRS
ncbi:MAG TPA: extracellular solute-binding protein [Alphaproteobacteria bacterium]|nr:extracellular solute-binding protein [Alphaproteobacteria bacterium]